MRKEEDQQGSVSPSAQSLRKLGAHALVDELIDGIEIRQDYITILQGEKRYVLQTDQASTFLRGLLRGRSWNVEDEPALLTLQEEPADGDVSSERPPTWDLEPTLDSLLALSLEAGILEGYEKDENTKTVRIDILACSTTLEYADALAYLIDCLRHELRLLRRY